MGRRKNHYGTLIGAFENTDDSSHRIKGTVYAIDYTTMFIKGFFYDGETSNAYFWVGNSARPGPNGEIVPYPEDYPGRLVH